MKRIKATTLILVVTLLSACSDKKDSDMPIQNTSQYPVVDMYGPQTRPGWCFENGQLTGVACANGHRDYFINQLDLYYSLRSAFISSQCVNCDYYELEDFTKNYFN